MVVAGATYHRADCPCAPKAVSSFSVDEVQSLEGDPLKCEMGGGCDGSMIIKWGVGRFMWVTGY